MAKSPREFLPRLVLSLAVACFVAVLCGCGHQPNIWVHGLDSGTIDRFSFNIDNDRISQSDAVAEFRIKAAKDEFFADLRGSYQVFAESEDMLQLIYNNEIYTVKYYADGHYALHGEFFMAVSENGVRRPFPFPTDKIVKMAGWDPAVSLLPDSYGTEFTANCDLPYLMEFYAVYGKTVKVQGNRISYGGIAITVEDGGLIEVDMP
jgi:hypothetical protein